MPPLLDPPLQHVFLFHCSRKMLALDNERDIIIHLKIVISQGTTKTLDVLDLQD